MLLNTALDLVVFSEAKTFSLLTLLCEILHFTINTWWETFLTAPVIFLLTSLGLYVVPWRAEPAHPQQSWTWWERHVHHCWQIGKTFIRWCNCSFLGAEPRLPIPSTSPGGISYPSDLASLNHQWFKQPQIMECFCFHSPCPEQIA